MPDADTCCMQTNDTHSRKDQTKIHAMLLEINVKHETSLLASTGSSTLRKK